MKNAPSGRPLRLLANLYAAQKASREMTGGILRYAAVHPEVEVELYGLGTPNRNIEEMRGWRPDGVIVSTEEDSEIRRIERIGCRALVCVNADVRARTRLRCGSVFCDADAVVEAAVGLFARKRLRHVAYVGTRAGEDWSLRRGEAVGRRAAAGGLSCAVFSGSAGARMGPRREIAVMARWIAALPKPCGVFAANDMRARDVLEACRAAGVDVPRQVMVLGVDDEEFVCRQTRPSLSSLLPDFDQGGFLAAELLVALLSGGPVPAEKRTFGVRGIVERLSTSDPNEAGRMVGRAEEFIRENAASGGVSVCDVAKAAGASVRLLQKNFRAATGTTVSEALRDARLRRVCELLELTRTPIGRMAELCGFGDDCHLKKLFRKRFGMTMRQWRRRGVGSSSSGGSLGENAP